MKGLCCVKHKADYCKGDRDREEIERQGERQRENKKVYGTMQ